MSTLEIILIILLLACAAAVVLLLVRGVARERRIAELGSENAGLKIKMETQAEAQKVLDSEREAKLQALEQQRLEAQKAIDEQRDKAFEEQKKQMEASLAKMSDAFKALSAENSEDFRRRSRQDVENLLKPVQEKFDAFAKNVKESDVKNAERSAGMEQMIKLLSEQSNSVGNQAKALADAITGQSKVQGDFGEMLLGDLLKASGLQEGVNFEVQGVLRDEEGHEIKSDGGGTMLPDVVVHYPDGGEVVVDSKVSLKAFVAWNQAVSAEERARLAKEHIRSIEKHIEELRGKDYASYISEGRKKIDYNIMFVPIEAAFQLMQQEAPMLWHRAKEHKVLIVSQMSLTVVLNMVLIAWRQHDQRQNTEEVFSTASELMTAIRNWLETYTKLGASIKKLNVDYDESTRQLTDSNQSVVKKIGKLEKLRVSPKRSKAAVKAGGRQALGAESVIPSELADGLKED